MTDNSKKNPWRTLSTKGIYENPWIKIEEDTVLTPGNTEGIYGRVLFKNRAVGIIPIDDQGFTYLVGQYRYIQDEYSWEIPMGGVPYDEDLQKGAARELREEVGLLANTWETLLYARVSNSVTNEEGTIFVARELNKTKAAPEATEDLCIKRMPLDEAIEMAIQGRITDLLSVTGLLKLYAQNQRREKI